MRPKQGTDVKKRSLHTQCPDAQTACPNAQERPTKWGQVEVRPRFKLSQTVPQRKCNLSSVQKQKCKLTFVKQSLLKEVLEKKASNHHHSLQPHYMQCLKRRDVKLYMTVTDAICENYIYQLKRWKLQMSIQM